MIDYLEFKSYFEDEEIHHVRIVNDTVELCTLTEDGRLNIYKRCFPENSSLNVIIDFLSDRCYEECRDDMPIILKSLRMKEYNPIEMVKKMHGRDLADHIWLKFKDNGKWENISWKDLKE